MNAKNDMFRNFNRKIGQLSVVFAVFSLLFITLVGCNSGDGIPVQGESNELRYDSPKDFWLANPVCNEYTDGMKAYVQDVYPYTCVRHNNEWLWTKVCEHNGIVHIDGESWFEGENCSKMMYHCDEGSLREYLGHSPDCGYDWSSNSTNQGVSSSSQTGPVGYTGSYGTLIDSRDGQSYKTVTIGTQTWMAENLDYHDSRLSDDDGGDSYIGANHRYTWAEAVDIAGLFSGSPITCNDNASGRDNESRCSMPEKVRGVCPTGWHLPSRGEWIEMFFVATGVKINDDGKYFQISDEKTKVLRSASGWEVCPGASTCRDVHGVGDILTLNGIVINEDQLNRKNGTDLYGLSFYPDIYVDGVTADRYVAYLWVPESRYFYNEITYDAVMIVIKGYYDSSNWDDGFSLTHLSVSRGSVRCVKDYASNTENSSTSSSSLSPTTYSSSSSFTQPVAYGTLVDARDGQSYKTVKIGEQTWMAENLNYEYPANSYEDRNFCFGNEPANCPKYGRFYKDGVVNRVCPDDWHLPSENEWLDLLMSGVSVKELRSTEGWLNGMNGSNVYGFSALPGGDNVYKGSSGDEAFENEGENACFWSSTLNTGGKTVVCVTRWDTYIFLVADKYHGYTVRCVKD